MITARVHVTILFNSILLVYEVIKYHSSNTKIVHFLAYADMARIASSIATRAAKKRAKPDSKVSKTQSPGHAEGSKPLISLQAFISNFFYLVAVQDDDTIFQVTYDKTEAPIITEKLALR